jgi:hypothetical protein
MLTWAAFLSKLDGKEALDLLLAVDGMVLKQAAAVHLGSLSAAGSKEV